MADLAKKQELTESAQNYSAKKAAAGKDIGKPGKAFSKIASSAGAKYGSKAAGERVAGAVLNKLRHANEGQLDELSPATLKSYDQKSTQDVANRISGMTQGNEKDFKKIADRQRGAERLKTRTVTDEAQVPAEHNRPKKVDIPAYQRKKSGAADWRVTHADIEKDKERTATSPEGLAKRKKDLGMDEGNAFSQAVVNAKRDGIQKGEKISVGGKELPLKELDLRLLKGAHGSMKGTNTDPESERNRTKKYGYRNDRDDSSEDDYDEWGNEKPRKKKASATDKSDGPKKKGRPKGSGRKIGAKGPSGHSKLLKMKENEISLTDRGEYNDEAGMAKDSLHTIVRSAKELEQALRSNENLPEWVQEKIGQIKGMMSSVTDYILSTHERDVEQQVVPEVAPPGAKAERMVKGIKKSLSKDGHLSDKDKAIAYATTWKAKKQGKVEEEGKPDFLDMDKDGDKKEPMKKAIKDKEEKVDETTVSGSVATAPTSGKSKGGMQFGKGVYESMDKKFQQVLSEGMNVSVNMSTGADGNPTKNITISADGDDAEQLAKLLSLAGVYKSACTKCGQSPCGCEETVDEAYGDTDETLNDPDWPTNTETLDAEPNLRTYSGGLNGPKSTGQSTTVGGGIPNTQLRRQTSMEESVELERSLWQLYKKVDIK
jgi:hypothetical protein